MSIPPRFVDELRDRLTLSEVVGKRVKISRAGREYKACCPFHREKSPSFYINDDKQFYHCFGCGAHGDVVGFVMQHDNLSFIEAVETLASQAGLQVPKQSPQAIEKARTEKSLHALLEASCQWFEARLYEAKNREVLEYLTKRGLSEETIACFRLGYAPDDESSLKKYLLDQGFTEQQMIETAVLRESQKGRGSYAFFRDRVMFPVCDMRGRVIAFSGRVLPEHLRPQKNPDYKPAKYMNSTDTPVFHKGQVLYAQQLARAAATDHTLVVVEGQMDVIACHQAGVTGAVAPLGTALTEDQISILWKMIPSDRKEPVLCFDGDSAGYRAAVRAADRVLPLLKANQSIRIAFLPEGEDPDTFISSRGLKAFQQKIDTALSLQDFLWTHHTTGQRFDTAENRAGLSVLLDGLAAKIQDGQVQYHYKQAFREKSRSLFNGSKFQTKGRAGPVSSPVNLPPIRRQVGIIPQILLLTILNHPYLYAHFADHFMQLQPEDPEFLPLFEEIFNFVSHQEGETLDREGLRRHLDSSGLAETANKLTQMGIYMHAGFARPGVDPETALQGFRDLWESWERNRLADDIRAAQTLLRISPTAENENRMLALQQMQMQMQMNMTQDLPD